jgi:peptidoglycan/xylan/chitin deacetylase (PgdA/CDA1 family)
VWISRRQVAEWTDLVGLSRLLLRIRGVVGLPWLTVVNYHRVDEPTGPANSSFDDEIVDTSPEGFDRQLEVMKRYFTFLSLAELRAGLHGGPLPRNPAMVTFDDGYLSCHADALPALLRHGARAVFFIATEPVSRRRLFWWDRIAWVVKNARRPSISLSYPYPLSVDLTLGRSASRRLTAIVKEHPGLDLDRFLQEVTQAADVPWSDALEAEMADRLVMTWDHVRALRRAGMDVASHTRTHRLLHTLDPAQLADELKGSREDLQRELGEPAFAISYPDGRAIPEDSPIRRAVRDAGYEIGFTYNTGLQRLGEGLDPLGVGRLAVDPEVTTTAFRSSLAIPGLSI